jgi:hypothetical protein
MKFKFKSLLNIIQVKAEATCVVTSKCCIQVGTSKFIFMKIRAGENFDEFTKFFPKGLDPI